MHLNNKCRAILLVSAAIIGVFLVSKEALADTISQTDNSALGTTGLGIFGAGVGSMFIGGSYWGVGTSTISSIEVQMGAITQSAFIENWSSGIRILSQSFTYPTGSFSYGETTYNYSYTTSIAPHGLTDYYLAFSPPLPVHFGSTINATDYLRLNVNSYPSTIPVNGSISIPPSYYSQGGTNGITEWYYVIKGSFPNTNYSLPLPPSISTSSLQQYKSDATTPISEGAVTTENTVVLEGVPKSSSNDPLELQFELSTSTDPNNLFANPIMATSSQVSSGQVASTTISGLVDGQYHWQAKAIDVSTNASSSWQAISSPPMSTDFIVHQVPLYTQGVFSNSGFPSASEARLWGPIKYGTGNYSDCEQRDSNNNPVPGTATVSRCGCAITSVVMALRYYGITSSTLGDDVNPLTLNSWLTNPVGGGVGYDEHGDLTSAWSGSIPVYAKDQRGNYRVLYAAGNNNANDTSILNTALTAANPEPVILYEKGAPEHFIVASGKLNNTYDVRDPRWYDTAFLQQNVTDSSIQRNYNNQFSGIRLYAPASSIATAPSWTASVASPVDILVTDPNGRKLGIDPFTGVTYNEIPNGSYIEDGISDPTVPNPQAPQYRSKGIFVPQMLNGQYTIQTTGTATGSYTLYSSVNDGTGNVTTTIFTRNTALGVSATYDLAFNSSQATSSNLVPQDTTPPIISHTPLASQYLLNSTPISFAFTATDTDSGVYSVTSTLDGAQIVSPVVLNFNQIGTHVIKISASDFAGNATITTLIYNVVYNFVGPLLPFKPNGNFFNVGRTLPVKFKAYDANNNLVSGIKASLSYAKVINGQVGQFAVASSSGNANIGNQFRFDPESRQYIYNWSIENISPGKYRLRIDLDDGTSHFADVVLSTGSGLKPTIQGGKDGNKNVFIYDFIVKQIINVATSTHDKRFDIR